jgi:acetyl esterase/lipase
MKVGMESLTAPELAEYLDEVREFNAAAEARGGYWPEPDVLTPDGLREAREGLSERPAATGPAPVELIAEAEGRQVPVRVLEPSRGAPRGVFLEIHGGGFYMGWAARSDARNRRLADALAIAVVSVDYRLAPEHPWPAAPDDCETAALWLLGVCEARFGTARLAIGGGSAGANLRRGPT